MLLAKNPGTVAEVITLCQSYEELRRQRSMTRRSTSRDAGLAGLEASCDQVALLADLKSFIREEIARQFSLLPFAHPPAAQQSAPTILPPIRRAIEQEIAEVMPAYHPQQLPAPAPPSYAQVVARPPPVVQAPAPVTYAEAVARPPSFAAEIVPYKVYMAQVDPVCQFKIDVGLAHPSKLLCLAPKILQYDGPNGSLRMSTSFRDLEVIDNKSKETPALKAMSIHIKCTSESRAFPKAENMGDQIIQIASVTTSDMLRARHDNAHFEKCVFVVGSCDSVEDVDVRCYDSETRMLEEFRKHVVSTDPDIITGYKVRSFDWPYILDRFRLFKRFNIWPSFSRRRDSGNWSYYSRTDKDIVCSHDRILIDMCDVIKTERKLRSDSLHSVVAEFLPDEAPLDDLKCSEIKKVDEGPLTTTTNSLNDDGNDSSTDSSDGEEENKAQPSSSRKRKAESSNSGDVRYQGAKVVEPKIGYYDDPVCTLDFASLYPSVIIAMNLCYSTLRLQNSKRQRVDAQKEGKKDREDDGDCYKYAQGKPSPARAMSSCPKSSGRESCQQSWKAC
ncbi:hypothetical protein HPB51_004894 [Rhipicephalus microplus]|uniref:DNA polymerase delta catalytic subunit n=1 Tax=Rhipicephalus microplus TaxID=6941 RepID=A0A9J6E5J1_RHIMP|nr:hypothetical protein HPB51_004894 [Rhipicephalus microplus]